MPQKRPAMISHQSASLNTEQHLHLLLGGQLVYLLKPMLL